MRWGRGHSIPPYPAPAEDDALARAREAQRRFVALLGARTPAASWALIGLCLLTFGLQLLVPDQLFEAGANSGASVHGGQLWRLWSATFLHLGLLHLASNVWALWVLGPFLERILGTSRFVVLYALSGLAGSILSGWIHPAQVSVGASGAIWGLMGAAFGLSLRPARVLPLMTAQGLKRMLLQLLMLNIVISLMPGIDKFAHFGGGAMGFLLAVSGIITLGARGFADDSESATSSVIWAALAMVLTLGVLASLAMADVLALARPR